MYTYLKRFLWPMLMPVLFLVSRIPVIDSFGQIISCALYLLANFLFACILERLLFKSESKLKKISYVCFFIVVGTTVDQIVKLVIHRFNVKINIVGEFLAVRARKNTQQMAMLNFLDLSMDTKWILLFKILMTVLMILGYWFCRKRNTEGAFGFIVLTITGVATILDTVCWGYTLDYVYFYRIVSVDLKDFLANIAMGYVLKTFLEDDVKKLFSSLRKN